MTFLRRAESSSSPRGPSGSAAVPAEELTRWPALLEFLTATAWPDGEARQTGSLLVFVDEGTLKACLNDRSQGSVAFVTGRGLADLCDVAEASLQTDSLDWRRSKDRKPVRK